MAEYVASSSCIKLHMQRGCVREEGFKPRNVHFRMVQRKYFYANWNSSWLPTWKMKELNVPRKSKLYASPCLRKHSFKCSCLGSLVNPESATASEWVPIVDQVLLMASIFLTYMAGIIPVDKSYQKDISSDNVVPESPSSSGSGTTNEDQVNSKYALDVVKEKLLNTLDAFERTANIGNMVLEYDERRAKRPLNLSALADGPRIRLLWASFQRIEDEVNDVSNSGTFNMDNRLTVFSEIIQKTCGPACMTWLERELCLSNNNSHALVSILRAKLKGDDRVLNIRKSGKEDLYADLLCFLCFGSIREGWCYDRSLFLLNGISILEDLVITLADEIAGIYLELISVDSNLSSEMHSMCLAICTLSTRDLQRLRNEVALNQWLYQNMDSVTSMYEDRFDLHTLQSQLIKEPGNRHSENQWWKRFTQKKSETGSSSYYAVISQFSMPVKRTKELRALTGWRYYFSLFLELSDISMPLIRAVVNKVSNALSFFLVTLIGRSLGLIYTGIRQSLRWK
ncbi:uncharacterized protein LOC107426566 [Ziziphus jujuba]|uniref:Uncharacterized protein LOC107426566 n=5 Tax=Ziziphus jujuba TaxID=326968 RepID=A0A6P4ABI5_ZIZJJ|nr:uncharacterized protein LOC107426566 [Ziziphus jujuba]XP_015892267.3 uncharacterized protein LOC107426566 [Ziziphus jujuba]XP_015892268.3 uncharacterized protein LOC107426566 [Ziziphus jujuba]XP_024933396.3 uncharacterized protein LOC107426566 [Ziziphus jujuba]